MKKTTAWLAAAAAAASLGATGAYAQSASPQGEWLVQAKNGRVRIAPCPGAANTLCGNLVWLSEPNDAAGKPKVDAKNSNPALRTRPVLNMPMITGMKPDGANKWSGGKIYNPEDGKTYNSKMELQGNGVLKVSGCVSVICKAQTWTRAK